MKGVPNPKHMMAILNGKIFIVANARAPIDDKTTHAK
jgi:hypothetical protein